MFCPWRILCKYKLVSLEAPQSLHTIRQWWISGCDLPSTYSLSSIIVSIIITYSIKTTIIISMSELHCHNCELSCACITKCDYSSKNRQIFKMTMMSGRRPPPYIQRQQQFIDWHRLGTVFAHWNFILWKLPSWWWWVGFSDTGSTKCSLILYSLISYHMTHHAMRLFLPLHAISSTYFPHK